MQEAIQKEIQTYYTIDVVVPTLYSDVRWSLSIPDWHLCLAALLLIDISWESCWGLGTASALEAAKCTLQKWATALPSSTAAVERNLFFFFT